MATKLEKDITRESTIKVDGKEINISLTANQDISMKLKGMRSGEVKIPIETLYNQLTNRTPEDNTEDVGPKKIPSKGISKSKVQKITHKNPMLSLYDLRSHNAISGLDVPTMAKFDQIIKSLIDANEG